MKTNLLTKRMKAFAVGTVISISSYGQIQHNLKLDLDFENGIVDSSSENQATALTGTSAYSNDQWNNAGACVQFSGTTTPGEVRLTNVTGSYKVSFPATVSAWVKINSFGATASPIFTTEDNSTSYSGLWLEVSNTGAVIAQYGNGGLPGPSSRKTFMTANGIINLNEWNHIAAVYTSASNVVIYVNGIERGSTVSGSASSLFYYNNAGTEGKIGSYAKGATNRTLDGSIDKLKIYGAALGKSEIVALYYTDHGNHSTLVFNYNMDSNFSDTSIYQQNSAQIGTCVYGTDRFSSPSGALNCSTSSAVEIQEMNGNFKTGFPMTFAAWIKVNALGVSQPIFTNNDRTNAYSGVIIQLTGTGNVAINVGDGTTTGPTARRTYITNSVITTGQWMHITVVLIPAAGAAQYTSRVYFDGVAQTMGAQSGTGGAMTYNTTGSIYGKIGAYYGGVASMSALNGLLDDVMFWDDSLTTTQITALYSNSANPVGVQESIVSKSTISVFPNPSNGLFTVDSENDLINDITVSDITGKTIVAKTNLNTKTIILDLTAYPQGLYLIRTNCGRKTIVSKLIIN